ncbi:unnamed protein product [Protopolystoma xenopodis]|uniref:Uncharacterized protein n=1 Tax=Protopolystoma xenopodis TaxID=117903 RepID=A0A448X4I8_9PLAT|nr:unnamed protein product [Protopolystoma xenopodis]
MMTETHLDAVSILGEVFATNEAFDFESQSTTHRINRLVPVMLEHRLTPPPNESYSLHRKLSGCFLLCSRLGSRINCAPLFQEIWDGYIFDGPSSSAYNSS